MAAAGIMEVGITAEAGMAGGITAGTEAAIMALSERASSAA
jgi:hypothetical protein